MTTGKFFSNANHGRSTVAMAENSLYTMKLANYYIASLKELETKIELETCH